MYLYKNAVKLSRAWFLVDENSGLTGKKGTVCLSVRIDWSGGWADNQTENTIKHHQASFVNI